jgi:stage V sporulation protein SpoVS
MTELAIPAKSDPPNSEPATLSDVSRYERACDEAIAMCDGNMRSTIKALLMANEYLEAELQDLQAAPSHHDGAARLPHAKDDAA